MFESILLIIKTALRSYAHLITKEYKIHTGTLPNAVQGQTTKKTAEPKVEC